MVPVRQPLNKSQSVDEQKDEAAPRVAGTSWLPGQTCFGRDHMDVATRRDLVGQAIRFRKRFNCHQISGDHQQHHKSQALDSPPDPTLATAA